MLLHYSHTLVKMQETNVPITVSTILLDFHFDDKLLASRSEKCIKLQRVCYF